MLEMLEIDQVHLRAVMLFRSMSEIVIIFNKERVLKEWVTILRPCKFPDLFWNQLRINIEIVYIPNVLKNNTSTHN